MTIARRALFVGLAGSVVGAPALAVGWPSVGSPSTSSPSTVESDGWAKLMRGNRRFVAGRPRYGHSVAAAAATSSGQRPFALVVGCIDSRVPLEAVFDQDFGDICVVRSGGHVLDRAVLGSIEFAVAELAVGLVVVLGHERCGAVAATIEAVRSGTRPEGPVGYLVDEIAPAVREAGLSLQRAVGVHVDRTARQLRDTLPVPVVGAVYDLDTGIVAARTMIARSATQRS